MDPQSIYCVSVPSYLISYTVALLYFPSLWFASHYFTWFSCTLRYFKLPYFTWLSITFVDFTLHHSTLFCIPSLYFTLLYFSLLYFPLLYSTLLHKSINRIKWLFCPLTQWNTARLNTCVRPLHKKPSHLCFYTGLHNYSSGHPLGITMRPSYQPNQYCAHSHKGNANDALQRSEKY